jgi:hypothetical protein
MRPLVPVQGRAEQASRNQRTGRYQALADRVRNAIEGDPDTATPFDDAVFSLPDA